MAKKTNKYKITYRMESIDDPTEYMAGETIRAKLDWNEMALFQNLIHEDEGLELRLMPKRKNK